jgi:hypothetical protein
MDKVEKEISILRESRVIKTSEIEYRESFDSYDLRKQIINAFGVNGIEDFDKMSTKEFSITIISRNSRSIMAIPDDVWEEIKEEATSMLLLHMASSQYE